MTPLDTLAAWVTAGGITDLRTQEQPMVLATQGDRGPDARVLLLRGLEPAGLVFFTNYRGAKGRQLAADSRACAVLHWPGEYAEPGEVGQRQARVSGHCLRLPADQSDAYFRGRALDHQLGAWLSAQSQPARGWRWLALRMAVRVRRLGVRLAPRLTAWTLRRRVPRPSHWGGYILVADRVELWEGRPSRLHSRQVWEWSGASWQNRVVMP